MTHSGASRRFAALQCGIKGCHHGHVLLRDGRLLHDWSRAGGLERQETDYPMIPSTLSVANIQGLVATTISITIMYTLSSEVRLLLYKCYE